MSKLIENVGDLLLVIVALLALAATKPDEAAHRAAIAKRTPVTHALLGATEFLTGPKLRYHDYIVFSTMSFEPDKSSKGLPVSVGILGQVYYDKDK
jgi:hypothetical protein